MLDAESEHIRRVADSLVVEVKDVHHDPSHEAIENLKAMKIAPEVELPNAQSRSTCCSPSIVFL